MCFFEPRHPTFRTRSTPARGEEGFILFVIVIAVAILALGGVTFVTLMSTERQAAHLRGREMQARALAESGEAAIRAAIEATTVQQAALGGLVDNPRLFRGTAVMADPDGGPQGRFSVVSPRWSGGQVTGVRFGLARESAKLSLAVLSQWERIEPGSARRALLRLPGMTQTAADSILDWIDPDDTPRPFGAEIEYYRRQGLPYRPRNAPPSSLEELLLVRDVTRQLMFGHDYDLNYLPETSGSALAGDPLLSSGGGGTPWVHLLTVSSVERNAAPNGEARIDLNQSNLQQLHNQLTQALGRSWADFVVLYRQHGPARGRPGGTRADTEASGADDEALDGRARRSESAASSRGPAESASGLPSGVRIDFSTPARVRLESPLDLIGATVLVPVDMQGGMQNDPSARVPAPDGGAPSPRRRGTTGDGSASSGLSQRGDLAPFASPIAADRASRADDVARLLDWATTTPDPVISGRVNVNEAPQAVLESVPGLTQAVVQQIIARRDPSVSPSSNARRHPTWLWSEGLVDLPTMRRLLPLLTCGGDVYRAQVIGFFDDEETAFVRIEVVLDASTRPVSRVYYKDLTLLGRGYSLPVLLGAPVSLSSSTAMAPQMAPAMDSGMPWDEPGPMQSTMDFPSALPPMDFPPAVPTPGMPPFDASGGFGMGVDMPGDIPAAVPPMDLPPW